MGCLRNNISPAAADAAAPSFHSGFFLATMMTPRKVSFEDTSISPSSCSSSDDSSVDSSNHLCQEEHTPTPSSPSLTRKRSLLRRPKSTMSLVDLAKQAEQEQESNSISSQDQDGDDDERSVMMKVSVDDDDDDDDQSCEPRAKRICSPRASPLPSPRNTALPSLETVNRYNNDDGAAGASFSWGQFVDMLVPEDDVTSPTSSPSHDFCYNSKDSICSSSSRVSRRSSPYGHYHNSRKTSRTMLLSQSPPSALQLETSTFTNSTFSKFRLAPRRNEGDADEQQHHHELLIGALADLNF